MKSGDQIHGALGKKMPILEKLGLESDDFELMGPIIHSNFFKNVLPLSWHVSYMPTHH